MDWRRTKYAIIEWPCWTAEQRRRMLRRMGMLIGDTSQVRPGILFRSPNITIGENAFVGDRCIFYGPAKVTIEDNVAMAAACCILTITHRVGDARRRSGEEVCLPVRIGTGSWLGAGVIVQPGVTIGSGCIVMAGAVVTKDCEPNGLYGGVPAKRIRDLAG